MITTITTESHVGKRKKQTVVKNISIDLPLGHVICVTGVSGSGKSSLVSQTIFPLLSKHINNPKKKKIC